MASRKKKYNILTPSQLKSSNISLNSKQNILKNTIEKSTLTIVSGPAGCSKTFSTCYTALKMLSEKKIEQIVITKPLVESGQPMGHLPGPIDEKVNPYMKSFISTFNKIIGKEKTEELMFNDAIIIEPLNFMRGETYDHSIILLDEGQNLNMKSLMLWITRLGKDSSAVLMGDISQYDVKSSESNFKEFREIMEDVNGVSKFEFDKSDIVRNPFLIEITDRYEKWVKENFKD
jgi:phosphate starvation-inducible PhoH-like protein